MIACRAYSARSHHMKQCTRIFKWTSMNKLQWNTNCNLSVSLKQNANVTCQNGSWGLDVVSPLSLSLCFDGYQILWGILYHTGSTFWGICLYDNIVEMFYFQLLYLNNIPTAMTNSLSWKRTWYIGLFLNCFHKSVIEIVVLRISIKFAKLCVSFHDRVRQVIYGLMQITIQVWVDIPNFRFLIMLNIVNYLLTQLFGGTVM